MTIVEDRFYIPPHDEALYIQDAEQWRAEVIAHAAELATKHGTPAVCFEVWWGQSSAHGGPEFDPAAEGAHFDVLSVDMSLSPDDPEFIVTAPTYQDMRSEVG